MGGCDTCSGVLTCTSPKVRYEGRIRLAFRSEQPASGIRVEFIRTDGPALHPDVLTAETDSLGWFQLTGAASGEDEVTGTLLIHLASPLAPIRIEKLHLKPTRGAGELLYLGEWSIPHPFLRYVGELFYRDTNQPAVGVRVRFRRTSGVRASPDTLLAVTDSLGRFYFNQFVTEQGKLVGDLEIQPPPPLKRFTLPPIALTTSVVDVPTSLIGRWGIGPRLPYTGLLVWESSRQPAGGVTVEFRRTSGVPVTPDPYVTTTNQFGTFALSPTPLLDGEVRGDVVVRQAGGAVVVARDLSLATVETDQASELIGVWLVPGP